MTDSEQQMVWKGAKGRWLLSTGEEGAEEGRLRQEPGNVGWARSEEEEC